MQEQKKKLIGMREICALVDRSWMTIDRWIEDGKFPPYEKVGNSKVWIRADVIEALRARGVNIDE